MGESLAPSIVPALKVLGVLPEVERAGFLRSEQTLVRWSGEGENLRRDHASVLVERNRFDRILLDAAVRAGASLLAPARARTPIRTPLRWNVPIDANTGTIEVEARFLVDASGKRSTLPELGVPTVALCGRWRGTGALAAPQMRIEAGKHAWFWGAPLSDGSLATVAFVDTCRCAGLCRDVREALYWALLETSKLLKHCMRGVLIGEIGVRDATCRIDVDSVTTNLIKIGDRSLAMDPLSSQGVQAAIRSGIHASAVIHTILSGGDTDSAIEFYRNAQQEIAARHRRVAADLYASQTLHHSLFWLKRAEPSVSRQPTSPTVVSLSLETRLRLSAETRMVDMPVIDGDLIRRRSVLTHPTLDEPIAWVAGVELCSALSIVGSGRAVSAILSDWSWHMTPVTAANLLEWLTQRRILVSA